MKKVLAILGIFTVLLLAGCANGVKSIGLKDCGSDKKCFNEAAIKCELAKVSLKENFNRNFAETYAESRGEKNGNCEFYMKLAKLDVSNIPLQGVSENFKTKLIELAKSTEGKDLTCNIPKSQIQATSFGVDKISSSENCSGTLKDALENLDNQIKELIQTEFQNKLQQ